MTAPVTHRTPVISPAESPLQETPPCIKSAIQTLMHSREVANTHLIAHSWEHLWGNDRHLDLSRTNITDEDLERILKDYKTNKLTLKSINLSGCKKISDKSLARLAAFPLEELVLARCRISDKGLEVISHLSLTKLDISDCYDITNDGLKHLATLPLKQLNLSGNKNISDPGLKYLVHLSLIELNLQGCIHITDKGLTFIARSSLKQLNLSFCQNISNVGLSFLAHLSLSTLSLSECTKITDDGLIYLASMPLTELDLSSCSFSDPGLLFLKNLPLKRLDLFNCENIGDTDLYPLAYFHSLESINLRQCIKVTDDTLASLVGSPLKHLEFSADEGVSDKGLFFLSSLPLEALLIYDGHNITDKGLAHLAPLRNLNNFYIEYARISGKGLKNLAHLPISTLYLECETLKDLDLASLASFPLKDLKLVGCRNITEKGLATHLAKLPLTELYLEGCKIPPNETVLKSSTLLLQNRLDQINVLGSGTLFPNENHRNLHHLIAEYAAIPK